MMRFFLMCIMGVVLTACGRGEKVSHVSLQTALGDIDIEIYNDRAPISAANFLYYVDNHLYDAEGFYRAVRPETDPRGQGMELIQGGLLSMTSGTAPIAHETTQMSGLSHTNGAISIARDEPGTGSAAYFFISIGDNTSLDYAGSRNPDGQGYAVFGQVIKGMDVVRAIQMRETGAMSDNTQTQGQFLTEPIKITKAFRN